MSTKVSSAKARAPHAGQEADRHNKAESKPKAEHVYLIDGTGFVFRAFHALPPLTRPDGTPINAVLGFTNMLLKIMRETDADHVAVVFDRGHITFRNEIYEDYKANREAPPEELVPQFELVREATRAFNLAVVDLEGFEADDLIATYTRMAREAGAKVTIVSADKDLMQLVEDGEVVLYDYFKNREIDTDGVREKFGVGPDKVIDVQALAGDSTDNVPGVPGIGVKTAAQLINEYGDLDALLDRAEEIKQPKRRENLIEHAEQARLSRTLVTLRKDAPPPLALDELAKHEPDRNALMAFLKEQGFKGVITRLEREHGDSAPEPAAKVERPAAALGKAGYAMVGSMAELARWIARAEEAGIVALGAHGSELEPERGVLAGLSLSVAPGEACYVPFAHRSADLMDEASGPGQLDRDEALAALAPLLAEPSVLKVGHDIKQDMRLLARYGLSVAPVDDAMLISYVLDGGLHGHARDQLAKLHLEHTPIAYKDVVGTAKSRIGFDAVPLDRARDYAAEAADVTLRLHALLKPRIVQEHMARVYERIERPLIAVLARMESAGIKVDRTELVRLSGDFASRIGDLETEIHKLAGHPFTIGSPKQLGEVLFDEMGLQAGRKGKSGAYSTGADILEMFAAQGHDLPARVLDWRQLTKLKSTYTDALVGHINERTGRVHTTYTMVAANTGRLSSNDPNLQNIPVRTEEGRKIRHAFIAEEGSKLLSADYSQIELRILAHVAGVDALKDAFRDGIDIHALTASQVFGVPIEGMDPNVRRSAKAINFGIIYGISPFGLARQIGVTQGEAKAYIEAYFDRYPGIRDYMEAAKAEAKAKGFVTTLFGRRCHLPGINDRNPAHRSFQERAAINAPIQGSAADIIKRAMIPMEDALKAKKLAAKMLLQVHDELIFEVPDDEVEETAALAQKVMAGAAHLSVPLVVDTGAADNWADAH